MNRDGGCKIPISRRPRKTLEELHEELMAKILPIAVPQIEAAIRRAVATGEPLDDAFLSFDDELRQMGRDWRRAKRMARMQNPPSSD